MRVAIVGAGGAGLAAGRHCLKENFSIDIFEQTGNVGGTWNYTDCVGVDENGLPVHSSMYKGLRTNLPKEVMTFEDFPYPSELEQSFIAQELVLNYMEEYSRHYRIQEHIKFFKHVVKIDYNDASVLNKWTVEVEDSRTKSREKLGYDAVLICIGHYRVANLPEVAGLDKFEGEYKHSHDYRSPKSYNNKKVLIVGSGPSGLDISRQIAAVATKVYVNHRSKVTLPLPAEIEQILVPIKRIHKGNAVLFEDGSELLVDSIVFCTGYLYSYPFLAESCEIVVDDNYVHPLYKHIVNIERPTMGFIGVPFKLCPFPTFDIQVRFFLSTLTGHFALPTKSEMYKSLADEWELKRSLPKRLFHEVGEHQQEYFDDLAATANISSVRKSITKLFLRVRPKRNPDECFKIIDDDNYIQIK